jgi:hypothetical protein
LTSPGAVASKLKKGDPRRRLREHHKEDRQSRNDRKIILAAGKFIHLF